MSGLLAGPVRPANRGHQLKYHQTNYLRERASRGSNFPERRTNFKKSLLDQGIYLAEEFAIENNLVETNTVFQRTIRRLYAWTTPNGEHRSQIDFIRVLTGVKMETSADFGMDHELQ